MPEIRFDIQVPNIRVKKEADFWSYLLDAGGEI
jgi:hypothetical protein